MRRLYVQIFLAFAGIAFLSMVMAGLAAWLVDDERTEVPRTLVNATRLMASQVEVGGSREATDARLRELAERLELQLTLWDDAGQVLGHSHEAALPWPKPRKDDAVWLRRRGHWGAAIRLDDGRWVGGIRSGRPKFLTHLAVLFTLGLTLALGCLPLARRITRRLTRLDENVKRLGSGELGARVAVEGRDEIAELASSFNEAAGRIQHLVESQRGVLISASHELRTPMTRLRLALELLARTPGDPKILEGAALDIEELDALVGDLLLGARLEAGVESARQELNLLNLAEAVAAGFDAEVRGEAVTIQAEEKLMKRALRNLLENAVRHGGGSQIEVKVGRDPSGVYLRVSDRGPGVPEDLRERIFEPFYRPAGHSESGDKGVGVGLALVRQIAEHHGGTARCLPREGGGSVFEIRLV